MRGESINSCVTSTGAELSDQLPGTEFVTSPGLGRLRMGTGCRDDYLTLAAHHYKAGPPVTVTAVYTVHHEQTTVVGRFLGREDEHALVAVLVVSLPRLACMLRDVATSGRYLTLLSRHRAQLLNREMRTISRVVVDQRYRGMGLAVLLVRFALARAETVYTESLAAMGRVNPFFARAGMIQYERPPRPAHARLIDALDEAGIRPCDLASQRLMDGHLDALDPLPRRWLEGELERWVVRAFHLRRTEARDLTTARCLELARDHLLAVPVYYLYRSSRHRLTQDEPISPPEVA